MKTESGPSGQTDDAVVTQEVGGSKLPVFGIAMDTIGRTTPTHMIPVHVRRTLAQYAKGTIPWYQEEGDSVASALAVDTISAEKFGLGTEVDSEENPFLNYTDVPLNPYSLDRLAFWRYDKDASEFDQSMNFEAQVCAVDAMSQLFVECFDFHFHYLAVLDDEYHRLRSAGKLGEFGEDRQLPCWNNQYHYWRDRVHETYLESGLVTLPAGLIDANWTINDVLYEILKLMVDSAGNFRPDIFITGKGAIRAKTGATLGLVNDAAYTDNDGNPRWYQPAWTCDINAFGNGADTAELTVEHTYKHGLTYGTENQSTSVDAGASVVETDGQLSTTSSTARSMVELLELVGEANKDSADRPTGRTPAWLKAYQASNPNWGDDVVLKLTNPQSYLQDFTTSAEAGMLDGTFYWRGHQLNLVKMIELARKIGRGLEPEVAEGFLPMFGLVGSPAALSGNPTAMSARQYDDLFNLYESAYSFNENPVRIYTAAHMGPLDTTLDTGELVLEGIDLSTKLATGQTLRQRFWEPPALATADQVGNTLSYFLPGAKFEDTMLGHIPLAGNSDPLSLAKSVDKSLIARVLGAVESMHTKVEKPVILKAGVASPDAAYASGIGMGGLQLVVEMLASAMGGKPTFGLGHNGFIDWAVTNNPDGSEDRHVYYPRSRHEGAQTNVPVYAYTCDTDELGRFLLTAGFNAFSEISDFSSFFMEEPAGTEPTASEYTQEIVENVKLAMAPVSHIRASMNNRDNVVGGPVFVASNETHMASSTVIEKTPLNATEAWGILSVPTVDVDTVAEGTSMEVFNQIHYTYGQDLFMMSAPSEITLSSGSNSVTVDPGFTTEATATPGEGPMTVPSDQFYNELNNGAFITSDNGDGSEFGSATPAGATIAATGDDGYLVVQAESGVHGAADKVKPLHMPGSVGRMRYLAPSASPSDFIKAAIMDRLENAPSTNSWLVNNDSTTIDETTGATTTTLDFEMKVAKWGQWAFGATLPADVGTNFASVTTSWSGFDNVVYLGEMLVSGTITIDNESRTMGDIVGLTGTFGGVRSQFAGDDVVLNGTLSSDSRFHVEITAPCTMAERGQTPSQEPSISPSTQPVTANHVRNVFNSHLGERESLETDYLFVIPTKPASAEDPVTWGDSYGVIGETSVQGSRVPGLWTSPKFSFAMTATNTNLQHMVSPGWLEVSAVAQDSSHPAVPSTTNSDYGVYQWQVPGLQLNTNNPSAGSNAALLSMNMDWHRSTLAGGSTPFLRVTKCGPTTSAASNATAYAGPDGSSATYVIPDKPENRMIYRPWRALADAAIAREQKMLFMPTHENLAASAGAFGLPVYGDKSKFRLAQMHYDVPGDAALQYILEKSAGKTRLVDTSNRGMLTFSKVALVDPADQSHLLPTLVKDLNDGQYDRGDRHKVSSDGKLVYSRELIRDIQLGRQRQKMANSGS